MSLCHTLHSSPQRGEPSAPVSLFMALPRNVLLSLTSPGLRGYTLCFYPPFEKYNKKQLPLSFPTGNFKPSPVESPFNSHHSTEKIPINLRKQSQFPFTST